jgi:hypothetical protein
MKSLSRPVGRADLGADFTFTLAELASNRTLQLDKPTGGELGYRTVPFVPPTFCLIIELVVDGTYASLVDSELRMKPSELLDGCI